MKKNIFMMGMVFAVALVLSFAISSSQAQTKEEKQFMKAREKEMVTFMEKCSGCHSFQRIFAKKRAKEDWDKILKQMAGKPHANISDEDLKRIEKWITFMSSTLTVGP